MSAGYELASLPVVNLLLEERLTQPLGQATVQVAFRDHRVDHHADVDQGVPVDDDLAGPATLRRSAPVHPKVASSAT